MMSDQPPLVQDNIARAIEAARTLHPAVHVVANGVRGDSRVIKSALASIDAGLPTIVLGITAGDCFDYFEAEGVPVLLSPFERPEHPRTAASTLGWQRREVHMTMRRAGRTLRTREISKLAPILRDVAGIRSTSRWSEARPTAMDINLSLARTLDALEPRLVHVHDALPLPAVSTHAARERTRRRRIVKVIYDAHECLPELAKSFESSPLYTALASIESAYIRDASRVVTVSPEIAALLKEEYELPSLPTVVTNGPTGVRDRRAPSLRDVIGLDAGVPLAVYAGWVAAERGLDTALRAMTTLPDLHLALVVGSSTRELISVLRLAHRLGVLDRVHTAPYVVPSQITQYLSSADVGLIPLKPGRHLDLSLPTKFREYAHAGLPMVVSDHDAMAAEINRTKIGRVFKAGNVGGLALQIDRVITSPDRYRKRLVPALLREYAWETQAEKLRGLYEQVCPTDEPPSQHSLNAAFVSCSSSSAESNSPSDRWQSADASMFKVRLGIGRANSAGQAFAWADALSHHLAIAAESFAPVNSICHDPHVPVRRKLSVQQGAAELGRVISSYTYLLIDGFSSLFGPLMSEDLEREIELLRLHQFGIGLIAHGSEVRDPDRHRSTVEGSFFDVADDAWVAVLRNISKRNRAIAERFDGPVFAATPDLIEDLPGAHWLPVVVDPNTWADVPPPTFGRRLRVMHQPSRSVPPIKGTDVIDPILRQLDLEGVIEYVSANGTVDAGAMPQLVARADVVVDQIRTGSYGVAAAEAMAAGRLVVGNLAQTVRKSVQDPVPILDAPPARFEEVIRALAQMERSELKATASVGREYVSRWHDGRESARVIKSIFLDGSVSPTLPRLSNTTEP